MILTTESLGVIFMAVHFGNRNVEQKLSQDADEVEVEALRLGSATIDSGIADERIASALDDFQSDSGEFEWMERDVANDNAVSGISAELIKRSEVLGDAYPFVIEGNQIYPKPGYELLTYKFCLLTSYAKDITTGPYTKLPRTFELVAKEYNQAHFGPFAKSFHTGWPRKPEEPKKFQDLAEKLHEETREWFWHPQIGLSGEDSYYIKDGGIDYITWLEMPDERCGKLFVLGQCACGKDWNTKFGDVSLETLSYWFNPISWVKPIKAFSTPYALVEGYLFDASQQAGIVYDRLRLSKLALVYEDGLEGSLKTSVQECIDLMLV